MKKKILVDMSATLIHHGHIRLLKKAKKYGRVIVGLTTDKEILKHKGYKPELKFKYRKEVLQSIKFVNSVISSPFYINDRFLKKNKIDILLHGNDNKSRISHNKIYIFRKTKNISSTTLRKKSMRKFKKKVGLVFLIEGYSGSGKSTFSNLLKDKVEKKIGKTIVLSGDNFRKILNFNKYKRKDRINNSFIFSKLVNLIANKGVNVIFSIVGLNNEIRRIYKKNIKNLILIYIQSDIKQIIRLKRKQKVYKQKKNIVGIDIKPEIPRNPDFVVESDMAKKIFYKDVTIADVYVEVEKFVKSLKIKK